MHNEAARRLAGYLFDMPEASRSGAYANALRNSGAGRMLLTYRVHRLGLPAAVDAAQEAVGTADNPVTDVDIVGGELVITYADGTTESLTLPAGMGGTTDQVVRDELDTHEASPHNTDAVARAAAIAAGSTASAASGAAATAQAGVDTNRTNLTDHEADANAHHVPPAGGGTGTDDQVAAEVPVDATGFSGNLGATDDNVQVALSTIDSLALGGGGGGGDPVTPTPPVVLVDGEAYTAHGDVTVPGWRGYDFLQFFYANGGNTYGTVAINTVQLIAGSPFAVPIGRNVAMMLTISATDDEVITTAFTSGNGVPAPSAASTLSVVGWLAGTVTEGGGALEWQDEGTDLAAVTSINLVGAGVVGTVTNGVLTITIAGGSVR